MGKQNVSNIERAHRRIYDSMKDIHHARLEWRVSEGARYYFQMMVDFIEPPPSYIASFHTQNYPLVGVLHFGSNQCHILLDQNLSPLTSELWQDGQCLALVDFPDY
jgi:hypothetical protein